ncbi:MAG: hypothetical protein ACOC53_07975 [Candidatus Saliniplasma sp.]
MNAKDLVEQILQDYPEARNSDRKLWFYYLKDELGWPLKKYHLQDMLEGYSFETLRRTRQHIQNDEGELIPTDDEIIEKRGLREVQIEKNPSIVWIDDRLEVEG